MKQPFSGHEFPASLHFLKDRCDARERLALDLQALLGQLDECIDATSAVVHRRSVEQIRADLSGDRDRLDSADMGHSKHGHRADTRERQLEAAMWKRWGRAAAADTRACSLWSGLVHLQLPLFNKKQKERWGHVDLLGVTTQREPLVIELKIGDSGNSPLHALLEGCAYAIALRDNWATYLTAMKQLHIDLGFASEPGVFPVAVVAESQYWTRWSRHGEMGHGVPNEAWVDFRALINELSARGFPVIFGSVDGELVVHPEFAPDSLRTARVEYP